MSSSLTSNNYSSAYNTRVHTAPAPTPDRLVREAEERVQTRINTMMNQIANLNDTLANTRETHSKEVAQLRKIQAEELESLREESFAQAERLKETTGLEIGKIYTVMDQLKRSTAEQFNEVDQKLETVVEGLKVSENREAGRRKALQTQIQFIEATLESLEGMHPERFASIKDSYAALNVSVENLREAYLKESYEYLGAKEISTRAIKLEKRLYALNLDYLERLSELQESTARNESVIAYLDQAMTDQTLIAEIHDGEKTMLRELDLDACRDPMKHQDMATLRAMQSSIRKQLENQDLKFDDLEDLKNQVQTVESLAGSFEIVDGQSVYHNGEVVKRASFLTESAVIKESTGVKIKEHMVRSGLSDLCVESGFINGNPNYGFHLKFKDVRDKKVTVVVGTDEGGKLSVTAFVTGKQLEENERRKLAEVISLNLGHLIDGEKPVFLESCKNLDTEEKVENYIRNQQAKQLLALNSMPKPE